MLIQIFVSLFVFFAILSLLSKKKRQSISWSKFWIWLFFWLAALVAVWIPNFLTQLANFLGIGRGADLVLYFGLLILFFLNFHFYVRLEKIEKNITKIVRDDALDNS